MRCFYHRSYRIRVRAALMELLNAEVVPERRIPVVSCCTSNFPFHYARFGDFTHSY